MSEYKLSMEDVLGFIISEQCSLTTTKNKASFCLTAKEGQQPLGEGGKESLTNTHGASSIRAVLKRAKLPLDDEAYIWRVVAEKFISRASGEITLVAQKGRPLSHTFCEVLLPMTVENGNITRINGIARELVADLVEKDLNSCKRVSGTILKLIALGKRSPRDLERDLTPLFKETNEIIEMKAIRKAVSEYVGQPLRKGHNELLNARKEMEQLNFVHESHKKEREARFFKNSPFIAIPYYLRQRVIRRELTQTNMRYLDALVQMRMLGEELFSEKALRCMSDIANRILKRNKYPELTQELNSARRGMLKTQMENLSEIVKKEVAPFPSMQVNKEHHIRRRK